MSTIEEIAEAIVEEAAKATRPVEVGDIFRSLWGYDQTNIDFYVVDSVTKSGKSMKVTKIGSRVDDPMAGGDAYDVVRPDPTRRLGESKLRRIQWSTYNEVTPYFKVASYANAYRWEGRPEYETASGYGH